MKHLQRIRVAAPVRADPVVAKAQLEPLDEKSCRGPELLDALEQFDWDLPAGVDRTRDAYRQFATANGLPAPSTIDRRGGGFTAMMAEMRERRGQRSAS